MKKRLIWSIAGSIGLISLPTAYPSEGRGELNFTTREPFRSDQKLSFSSFEVLGIPERKARGI